MKYILLILTFASCTIKKGMVVDKLTVVDNYFKIEYILVQYTKNNALKQRYLHCNEMQFQHFQKKDSVFFKGILLY